MTVSFRPLQVLLVEDDDDHADLTALALEAHDARHQAVRAHDGAEALDILFRRGPYADAARPDVVLLDLNLPRVGGLEVLAALKEDDSLRRIPVVILTTSDDERDRRQAYSHHANSYLVKPADYASFEALVRDFSEYWGHWNHFA